MSLLRPTQYAKAYINIYIHFAIWGHEVSHQSLCRSRTRISAGIINLCGSVGRVCAHHTANSKAGSRRWHRRHTANSKTGSRRSQATHCQLKDREQEVTQASHCQLNGREQEVTGVTLPTQRPGAGDDTGAHKRHTARNTQFGRYIRRIFGVVSKQ